MKTATIHLNNGACFIALAKNVEVNKEGIFMVSEFPSIKETFRTFFSNDKIKLLEVK